ncbi:MAG: hypothetical protein LBI62_05290 [Candidatus Accumulibacter sp.]|nr:hypothetical protein [Accumulibacter sp.]
MFPTRAAPLSGIRYQGSGIRYQKFMRRFAPGMDVKPRPQHFRGGKAAGNFF